MCSDFKVPLTRPWMDEEEIRAVSEVIRSGWLTQGPKVTEFEGQVAAFTGAAYAVATSNCTTALQIALHLHGIGPGDEVVVPSYTWIATPNGVLWAGARPVFADIDLSTFNITAETVAPCLGPKTKAILLVHQFGCPADGEAISALARKNGLVLIEDAACALGSERRGRKIGDSDHLVCFSFHPRKVVTLGEGGMLLTKRSDFAERARRLINHGASLSDVSKHRAGTVAALTSETFPEAGFNFRMTNLQGALGTVQMRRLPDLLRLRRLKAARYSEAFRECPSIQVPKIPGDGQSNWQSYAIRITEASAVPRDRIAQRLLDAGIACRPAYMACHIQPFYRRLYPGLQLPETEKALASVLILPLYPQMTDEEQDYVIEHCLKAVEP